MRVICSLNLSRFEVADVFKDRGHMTAAHYEGGHVFRDEFAHRFLPHAEEFVLPHIDIVFGGKRLNNLFVVLDFCDVCISPLLALRLMNHLRGLASLFKRLVAI